MSFKFAAKEIGLNRATEVKYSQKNVRRMYAWQLEQAKVQDMETQISTAVDNGEDVDGLIRKQYQMQIDFMDHTREFMNDVLKLTAKQLEKFDDMEVTEATNLAVRLSMRLMGMSDKQVTAAMEANTEDEDDTSKKSAPESESSN